MSLNSEITRIENAKEDIKDAIEEMGGEVGEGTIDTYATAVRSIPTGIGTETDPVFTNSPAYGITSNDITSWNGKSTFSGSYNDLTNKPDIKNALIVTYDETNNVASHTPQEIKNAMDSGRDVYFKQDGNGEIFFAPVLDASATLGKCYIVKDGYNTIVPALYSITIDSQKSVSSNYQLLQEKLVSGTNIKTINNISILGSGNITISGGSSSPYIYTGTDTQTDEDEFISLYENYMSTGNWDLKRIAYKNTSNVIDAQIPMVGATYFRRQYNIYDICEFYFAGYSVNANTGNQNFIFVEVVCTFNISNETTTVGITCTEEVLSKEATSESIAPIYTKGNTYAVGDYVMSNGKLYVCNTAISSAGAWVNESSKWTQTTIIDVIKNL